MFFGLGLSRLWSKKNYQELKGSWPFIPAAISLIYEKKVSLGRSLSPQ